MKKFIKKLGKRPGEAGTVEAESPGFGASGPRPERVCPERFGLILLAESTPGPDDHEQYPLDVIAVHGLAGDAYATWTHENGTLWLRDLLPGFLPGCRVFTYGYPSQVAFSTSFARVQEYARQLLNSIRDAQDDLKEASRPVILICHSLGGIVCKQALVFAHEDDAAYGGVLKSITGIAFLGTPHRGSDAANLGSVVGTIVNTFVATTSAGLMTKPIRTDLLDYLKYDSRHLHDLNTSVRNRLVDLTIISFYESEAQPPSSSVIVDRNSAILSIPREEIIPLYANHRDMCRFAGETNEYRAVSRAVRRIAQASRHKPTTSRASTHSSQMILNDSEKSCMRLFMEFDVSDFQAMLPTPANGTCQWILGHPLFVSWLEKTGDALLWLTGHAGCGKKVLSFFLAKQLEETATAGCPRNVLIFFCDDKISKQRDANGILIGLILQLIHRHRSLIRHASKVYEMQGQNIVQSFTALWTLFVAIATDPRSGPVYIIVDAIDECEKVTRHLFLDSIRAFFQKPNHSKAGVQHVKFLLTSRPTLMGSIRSISDISEHRISIDEGQGGYNNDVQVFVQQRVDELSQRRHFSPGIRDFLLRTLNSKSGQTFLWVHMVLSSLENSLRSSQKDLQEIITRIPPDLEATYRSFFSTILPGDQDMASKLLKLILGSSRPLTLDEINIALTIDPSHRAAEDVVSSCQAAMQHTLQGILGPLVRVSDSKVALVHQSAKEFILQRIDLDHQVSFPAIRAISGEDCALVVASACIDYLLLDDFTKDFFSPEKSPARSISSTSDSFESSLVSLSGKPFWDEDVEELNADALFRESGDQNQEACEYLVSKHAFYRYAALHWTEHFALCEATAPTQLREAAKRLLDINTTNSSNWLIFRSSRDQSIPKSLNATSLAAHFNLYETLKDRLGSEEPIPQADMDHALFWGSERGHSEVVDALLQAGADPNAAISRRQTALIAASKNGHHDCVAALVTLDRTDVNIRGQFGRTALSFACGGGHMKTIQMLLSRAGCKADEGDDSGATALFWAAGAGHLPAVSLLVRDPTVDVNHRDKRGRTAASWAAGDGMGDVLLALLKVREVDANLEDNKGRSPLSWAAGNGCTAAVRVLMHDRKADKATIDNDKRGAISWASSGGHLDTLRLLLKHGCPGVDDRDVDGWTPLAWAIQTNSPDVVETLLSTGHVNLEQGDHSGRSALSWAAEYGHLDNVRALLRAGADPSSKNKTGITPMSTAEKLGRDDIVEEILSHIKER